VGLVARGHHYLTYGPVDKLFEVERLLAQRKLIRPQYFFTKKHSVVSYEELKKSTALQVRRNKYLSEQTNVYNKFKNYEL